MLDVEIDKLKKVTYTEKSVHLNFKLLLPLKNVKRKKKKKEYLDTIKDLLYFFDNAR